MIQRWLNLGRRCREFGNICIDVETDKAQNLVLLGLDLSQERLLQMVMLELVSQQSPLAEK